MEISRRRCPGCLAELPEFDGPVHAYIGASPACWAKFGLLLAREYQDPAWFQLHQMTVDAYATQHPGTPGRRSTQSVALHLMTLGMILERDLDPADAPRFHKAMAHRPDFTWLEPPWMAGRMKVTDVLGAEDVSNHERLVRKWGADVWDAWSPHHAQIWEWVELSLGATDQPAGSTSSA